MEEETKHHQQQHIASGASQIVVTDVGVEEMGGNRSASTSSTVGLVMSTDGGSGSSRTPPPKQSSKRDSGYHTDCSPATFSTAVPHFTFDTADTTALLTESGPAVPRGSTLSPGWQPHRVLPEVSDDDDDDEAFVAESVVLAAGRSALQSRLAARTRAATPTTLGKLSTDDQTDGRSDNRATGARLGHVTEEAEDRDDDNTGACRHGEGVAPSSSRDVGGSRDLVDADDEDDEAFEEEEGGVATTDYHHAPLSVMRLPSGDRIRPLIARTIATQTPHLHCQLIDQILHCPQGVPACARGSAVRRLRYYSEGEETVGQSSLSHGPLPDLVPVTHVTRERSLSAPDLETLQRQRVAAREVGRELRRISDEFLQTYHARGEHRDGALAALHAELNGVAAFFLTGVRRFMYRGFAGYFRHVFNWTRRASSSADLTSDSSVDEQR